MQIVKQHDQGTHAYKDTIYIDAYTMISRTNALNEYHKLNRTKRYLLYNSVD